MRRKLAAFFVSLFICVGLSFAQDSGEGEWFWDQPITKVDFEGLKNVKKSELTGVVSSYIGHGFTEEVYKTYLTKKSINKVVNKYLNQDLSLFMKEYHSYDSIPVFEACFKIPTYDEDIRTYLDDENMSMYDINLYKKILDKNVNASCFLKVQNKVIKKILENNAIPNEGFDDLKFLIYQNDNYLNEVLQKLKKTKIKVIIECNILDNISAFTFDSKLINGIYLSKGASEELRSSVIHLAKIFNLNVYSNYKLNDFNKCIYLTDKVHEIK